MKSYIPKIIIRRERTLVCDADTKLNRVIAHSGDLAPIVHGLIGDEMNEVFILIALTARHKVTGYQEVARGGLTSCAVSVGDVARAALLCAAPVFAIAHNHPSGDPAPSREDLELTERIKKAFDLLGLSLIDHVIVGYERHASFLDLGLLK